MELKIFLSFLTGVFSTVSVADKKDVENRIYSRDYLPVKPDNFMQHLHHRRHHHNVQQAQRRDSLGFLKTFTEENFHFNKLFKEKLEQHRNLKEKNFIGSTRAKVEKRKPILMERYNEAEDDDNVYDEDEMAEISQNENIAYSPTRLQNSKKYKYGGRNYGYGINVYGKRKQKEIENKMQKNTFKTSNDVDEASTSGEEFVKTDSHKTIPQNKKILKKEQKVSNKKFSLQTQDSQHLDVQQMGIQQPGIQQTGVQNLDVQQQGVRKHSMSTHSSSPMKNLAHIPILPILPLPLLYSSGDQETSASSGTDDIKSTNEVIDNELDRAKVVKEVDRARVESGNDDRKKRKKENHVSGDWVDKLLAADQESNGFDEDDDFDEESEEIKRLGKNVNHVEHNSSQQKTFNTVQEVLNPQNQQSTLQSTLQSSLQQTGNSKYQQVLQFNGENRFSNRNDNIGKTFSGTSSQSVNNQYNFNSNKNKNVSLIENNNSANNPPNNQVASNIASIHAEPYYTQNNVPSEQPFASLPILSSKPAGPSIANNIVSSQFQSDTSSSQYSSNTVLPQTSSYIPSPQALSNIVSPQISSSSALPDLIKNQPFSQTSSQQYLFPQTFNDPNTIPSGTILSSNAAQFNNNAQQKYDQSFENLTLNQFNYPGASNQLNTYTTNADKLIADNNIWKSYTIPLLGNSSTIENVYIIPQGNNANNVNSPQLLSDSNINSVTSSSIVNNYGVQNPNIVTSEDQNICASSCPIHCAPSCDQVCCTKDTIALDQSYISPSIKYPSPKPLFLSELHGSHSQPIGATPILPNNNEIISGPNTLINRQPNVFDLTKNPQNDNLMFMNAQNQIYPSQPLNHVPDFVQHDTKAVPAISGNTNNEYNLALQKNNVNQQLTMTPFVNKFQGANIMNQQFSNSPISNQSPTGQEGIFRPLDDKKTTFSLQPMKPYFLKVPSLSIVHLRKDIGSEKANNVKYPNPTCFKGCRTNCLPHCSNYCCGVATKRSSISLGKNKAEKRIS
ncbi:GATA zinc finger domain-containing protein 14 [Hydra vulgaris]|uniref:GATA zinc finger domain-containing protein 14 n=1 Tax=Hydra vulgaris TaxID=6087 RepID=UPI001F5E935B|nr:GATA zinc finger domain-containing protein 14 [Hydra vulgaris]